MRSRAEPRPHSKLSIAQVTLPASTHLDKYTAASLVRVKRLNAAGQRTPVSSNCLTGSLTSNRGEAPFSGRVHPSSSARNFAIKVSAVSLHRLKSELRQVRLPSGLSELQVVLFGFCSGVLCSSSFSPAPVLLPIDLFTASQTEDEANVRRQPRQLWMMLPVPVSLVAKHLTERNLQEIQLIQAQVRMAYCLFVQQIPLADYQ
ncbi:hypothetical protein AOLI_G00278050 [Acnodon oligacanthus]